MEPGILKVTEKVTKELEAIGLKLHITVAGEKLIYGNAALEKCSEVKQVVDDVRKVNAAAEIVTKGVYIKSETGWFTKSSRGVYQIEVRLNALANVNETLGAIIDARNVELRSFEWIFDDESVKMALIKQAMKKAKEKAESMVGEIGYKIIGIRSCSDSYEIPNVNVTMRRGSEIDEMGLRVRSSARNTMPTVADFGTELRGKKEVSAVIAAEFLIGT